MLRQLGLRHHPFRGQHIGLAAIVVAGAEVSDLDLAFVNQSFEAIIDQTKTEAELCRQGALGQVGVFFQNLRALPCAEFGFSQICRS
jgi:hypothetical protein